MEKVKFFEYDELPWHSGAHNCQFNVYSTGGYSDGCKYRSMCHGGIFLKVDEEQVTSCEVKEEQVTPHEVYEYKGKPYTIMSETKMKVGKAWVDAIVYQTLYENKDGVYWVREKGEFYEKFKLK